LNFAEPMSATTSPLSALRPVLRTVLGVVLLALPLWLGLLNLPAPFSLELMDARPMALDYAVRHGYGLGSNLPSSLGPLGALLAPVHSGQPLWLNYWCHVSVSLVLALGLAWIVRRASVPLRWWLFGLFLMIAGFRSDYLYLSVLVLGGMMTISQPLHRLEAVGLGLGLGLVALIEVHFAWLAMLAVSLGWANRTPARSRSTLLLPGVVLIVVVLIGWLWTGQPAGDLLPWLVRGLTQTAPRHASAAVAWPGASLLFALLAGGITLVLGTRAALTAIPRGPAIAIVGFLVGVLITVWRQATGQPQVGPQPFLTATLMIALGWLAWGNPISPPRGLNRAAVAVIVVALLGFLSVEPRIVTESIIILNQKIAANVTALADRRGWQRSRNDAFRNSAQLFALPRIKAAVTDHRTDLLGNALCFALVNQWNYSPRPGLQGFRVLDSALAGQDADAYRGSAAPAFVAQRLQAFDRGLAALEDAPAQRALYAGYDYLFEENGFILWQRRENSAAMTPLGQPVWETKGTWDQPIPLTVQPDHAYWLQIRVHRSLIGCLRQQAWFPADPTLVLKDADGGALSYRTDPAALRTGFLLYPLFRGEIDLVRFQAGEQLPVIREIRLQKPAGREADFAGDVELSLFAVPAPAVSGRKESAENLATRFAISNRLPVAISAYFPPQTVTSDGMEVLLAHPDSSIEFPIRQGDRGLQGQFGLLEGAYQNGNATDGVEFVAEYVPAAGPTVVLWRRQLDPLQQPADRGRQNFSLVWPQSAAGRLVLRTHNLPGHNAAWDWSFWTGLRFESSPATP